MATLLMAVSALVRTEVGESRVELERVSDSHYRFTMKKASIRVDVSWFDVIPDFMTARKEAVAYVLRRARRQGWVWQ